MSFTHLAISTVSGPSDDMQSIQDAQTRRYEATKNLLLNKEFTPKELEARKQYWTAQTFFLHRLLSEVQGKSLTKEEFEGAVASYYRGIASGEIDVFLTHLHERSEALKTQAGQANVVVRRPGMHLYEGDVIGLMRKLVADGYHVVVDDAANSNRDGCAKYSSGSVEELLARQTDAWQMVLHFEDVHHRNFSESECALKEKFTDPMAVKNFQQRYVRMMLYIVNQYLKLGETYLNSTEFLLDLFDSLPSTQQSNQLPIYFDIQNNAYEVPINGFQSTRSFFHQNSPQSIDDIFNTEISTAPVTVVSYAAPDQRLINAVDRGCTSNKILQNPSGTEVLANMLTAGVNRQCFEAVKLAKQNPNSPVAVVFIMPGCGAFGNPEDIATQIMFDAINQNHAELQANHITSYVVERSPGLFGKMVSTCKGTMTGVPQFIEREKTVSCEKANAHYSGANIELRLQNVDLNDDLLHSAHVVTVLPKNLGWQSKRSVNASKVDESVIQIDVSKKYDVQGDPSVALKNSYLSALRELAQRNDKNISEAHFILIGTGKLNYTAEESMQGFLAAVEELGGAELPLLVMHIEESSKHVFNNCKQQLESVQDESMQAYRPIYWALEQAPAIHRHAMTSVWLAVQKHNDVDLANRIDELQQSFAKDSSLKNASLAVTCDKDGHLILQVHLTGKNGSNNLITIGTFEKDFYQHMTTNSIQGNGQIENARRVKNVIESKFSGTVDQWHVHEFVDLVWSQEIVQNNPDFHLDLMGSGETENKYKGKLENPSLFQHDGTDRTKKVVIDGPSELLGKGFDANVINGFCELLHKIGNTNGALHIQVSGHSRGGVGAVAINNLLVDLKQIVAEQGNQFSAEKFIGEFLKKIKANPDEFRSAYLEANIQQLIERAVPKLQNITLELLLLDPVQGPDSFGFNHNSYLIAQTLKLDAAMNTRVNLVMGSRESSSSNFDLHLPAVIANGELPGGLHIYKVNCNHGGMEKKLNTVSKNAGSFEGYYAACVLSGRPDKVQTAEDLQKNRPQYRVIEPSYSNRAKVYAAGCMITERQIMDEKAVVDVI